MHMGRIVALLLLVGIPSATRAAYFPADAERPVEVHGFASPGTILSTNNVNYLVMSAGGSFEFTEIGINVTKQLTEKLRFGLQLFTRDLGAANSYRFSADWFYLDYHWRDSLGIRAGRVKIPFGLYNDIADVDAARVPVLLPQSLYPTQNRQYLLAQTGMELYGYLDLDTLGALDYRAYFGTIFLDITGATSSGPLTLKHLWTRYIAGGRLLWETPLPGLRVGGTIQALQIDTQFLYQLLPTASELVDINAPVILWVASAEFTTGDLVLTAEYSRWHVAVRSSNQVVEADSSTDSERAYIMASYRVAAWLQPALYYALLFPNVSTRHGRANQQHDVAATLRFDINAHWLVKVEGHYMNGTGALDPTLNNNQPLGLLPDNWGLVLLKSTAYF